MSPLAVYTGVCHPMPVVDITTGVLVGIPLAVYTDACHLMPVIDISTGVLGGVPLSSL